MPELENTNNARPVLRMQQLQPGLVALRREAAVGGTQPAGDDETLWSLAIERFVQAAFSGRDVCFIVAEPPLAWSDLELERLGGHIATLPHGESGYRVVFAAQASDESLSVAAASQDFRHGGLLIAAIPAGAHERVERLLAALSRAGAGLPPWQEWIRLPRAAIEAQLQAQVEAKLSGDEEFVEGVDDGEQLDWYHPQPAALEDCRAALEEWAERHGWQLDFLQTRGRT